MQTKRGRKGEAPIRAKDLQPPLVVIVDDDASVRRSTCRLVRSFGFAAEAFASAEEYLASGRAAKTRCLIVDVRMPGLDGLELQRRLADHEPRIPIVFLTGRASDEDESRARRNGALAFLRKPVGKPVLLGVLRAALESPSHESRDAEGRGGVLVSKDPVCPSDVAPTPAVKAIQTRKGSRRGDASMERRGSRETLRGRLPPET